MDIVHPRVAGIDVHKKIIWVAVRLPGEVPGGRTVTVKSFRTFWRPLQQMAAWLAGLGVTDAAMGVDRGVLVAGPRGPRGVASEAGERRATCPPLYPAATSWPLIWSPSGGFPGRPRSPP